MSYTVDELMAVCISRQIEDGEVVAQGIATPLVASGYLLAKLTHAPEITFISAIGQALCREWAPLGVATIERLWIGKGLLTVGFVQAASDLLPRFGPKEFFRPGQVDAYGNFNNVYMGGTYDNPRLRLPGSGGIPDVTVFEEKVYLYVPRHGRHTFVEELDFRSGLGHHPVRRAGYGPRYLVSDLGQFDFEPESGRMRLVSLHPGVSLERVQAKTGFDPIVPDDVPETEPPSAGELRLLREEIDPLGVRALETLSGAARRETLRQILAEERAREGEPDHGQGETPTL
ncbi:MAG: CoA-transferase [Candidatus Promineifilaceae bacterium]|nr:CoA-transferase [Candidatus Promineifilaceae bacterium]